MTIPAHDTVDRLRRCRTRARVSGRGSWPSLAGREGQEVTDALLARLGDPDAHVRRQAVQVLAGREGQDVTDALLARLSNPRVCQQAMRALSERGSPGTCSYWRRA